MNYRLCICSGSWPGYIYGICDIYIYIYRRIYLWESVHWTVGHLSLKLQRKTCGFRHHGVQLGASMKHLKHHGSMVMNGFKRGSKQGPHYAEWRDSPRQLIQIVPVRDRTSTRSYYKAVRQKKLLKNQATLLLRN